jgi:hypothetical protein
LLFFQAEEISILDQQIFKTIVKTHKTEVIPLNQFAQAIHEG